MLDELNSRRAGKRESRADGQLNINPSAERSYFFRGTIFHSCGRRMAGDTKQQDSLLPVPTGTNNRG
ncbi:hypothetical protein GCM10027598_19150 [Amycolatopsis oliviviridis]|uniref:Uncharacterized protein n=1 Tax=Amycolatopsis oliviviridis TaxID=1471590 RepID=A0ABQ3LGU5_9PSEU|nr:hypothetical protein [Amycolatopsis oliviviridis]GHH13980.1 hypothetical protein GCM10017790_26800 [Amycolatopsis oliviviridis]